MTGRRPGWTVIGEARASLQRRRRSTRPVVFGIALGIGCAVAAVGLGQSGRIATQAALDRLEADTIQVGLGATGQHDVEPTPEAIDRALSMPGVIAGGRLCEARDLRSAGRAGTPAGFAGLVYLTSPGGVAAQGIEPSWGAALETSSSTGPVAVVGSGAAQALGIPRAPGATVWIGGREVAVVGGFDHAPQRPELLAGVLIDQRTWPGGDGPACAVDSLIVHADRSAVAQVAQALPFALRPDRPDSVRAAHLPRLSSTRAAVDDQSRTLLLALAAMSLLVAVVAAGNAARAAAIERFREIGLRRSLGATGWQVAAQFAAEGAVVGIAGGALGGAGGLGVTAVACLACGWLPVLPWWTLPFAVGAGVVTGAVGSVGAARWAVAVDPADALLT